MKNRLLNLIFLVLVLILSINTVRSWFVLQQRASVIRQSQEKLDALKEKQESLEREYARVEGKEYLEKEARNKLNMGKEGEVVVFLPSISPIPIPTPTPTEIPNNWLKWMKIFQ